MEKFTGLLASQVGYDLGSPVRVLWRTAEDDKPQSAFLLHPGGTREKITFREWGSIWGSTWWIWESTSLSGGDYTLQLQANRTWETAFTVGTDLLFRKTWRAVALEHLQGRARLAKNRVGWQDCGAHWQEANSHACMVLGLLDLLEYRACELGSDRSEVEKQVRNGLAYLGRLQDRANQDQDLMPGGIVHEIPEFPKVQTAGDSAKAATCWARAARWMESATKEEQVDWGQRAAQACLFLRKTQPLGFSDPRAGVLASLPARNSWSTPDLHQHLMALLALYQLVPDPVHFAEGEELIADLLERQVSHGEGLYNGHFRMFAEGSENEPAWSHYLNRDKIGDEIGQTFPFWVFPLLEWNRVFPHGPQKNRIQEVLHRFVDEFFIPGCLANPFCLLPRALRDGQLLWFAGAWHGMNTVYALAAVLARELNREFPRPELECIATGNLQWIAGLNAGLTSSSLVGCEVWRSDIPDGEAIPVSMINGLGHRWAGTWFNARGSIANGFSTGRQFQFDVEPIPQNDAPSSFTDEDWITHSGAWLSGVSRGVQPVATVL